MSKDCANEIADVSNQPDDYKKYTQAFPGLEAMVFDDLRGVHYQPAGNRSQVSDRCQGNARGCEGLTSKLLMSNQTVEITQSVAIPGSV